MDRLITPEAVELDLPIATVATRALGRLLDAVIQIVALLLIVAAGSVGGGPDDEVVTVVVGLLAVFLVRIAYPIALETRFGATLGQRAMGLRIVTDDGAPIRLRQAFTRAAIGLFEIELTGGLVAFVVAASRADGKRLGDIAAGTVAVSVRVGTGRADVLGVTCPPRLVGWAEQLDTTGLTPTHRAALRRFHERAGTLPARRRAQLAADMVPRLLPVVGARRPPGADDVDVLRALEWAAGERGRRREDGLPPPPGGTSGGPPPPTAPPPSRPRQDPPADDVGRASTGDGHDGPTRSTRSSRSDERRDGDAGSAGFAPPS